jgi:outer membrane protein OmpA-like peptidoglycan-associated protein
MRQSAAKSGSIAALAFAIALWGAVPSARAQVVGYDLCLAGFFSEARILFPLSAADGDYRPGGGLRAGFELVGLPDSPWLFDLAGTYDTMSAGPSQNALLVGAQLRAGYALAISALADISPFVSVAIAFDPIKSGGTILPGIGIGFELTAHLGAWGYLSLIPEFAYPIGAGAPPSFGLALAFKQLSAWENGRPREKPQRLGPSEAPLAATAGGDLAGGLGVSLDATPEPFSPDGDGKDDTLAIAIRVRGKLSVRSWELELDDAHKHRFFTWSGQGTPPELITWDGRSATGELADSASDYSLSLIVTEGSGQRATATTSVTTDVLVFREGERYKMRIPSIIFPANSASLSKASAEEFMKENFRLLNRLAEILRRFPDYRITIEGHANLVNWEDPSMAAAEDRDVSRPLSLQRAQEVKTALVQLGIRADRIGLLGLGAQEPLVPFGDKENNWKNRRVEILLDR